MMNQTLLVTNGSRTVVINNNDGHIWWNLYVNSTTQNGRLLSGDITLVRGKAKTLKGALKAAEKAVA